MTVFGWGAVLLAYLTVQRVAELWWAKHNERRLFAAGGGGHSGYFVPGSIALRNLAYIALGDPAGVAR